MAKKYPGGVSVLAPFEIHADAPIADYMVVDAYSDLASLRKFDGMLVYVTALDEYHYYTGTVWKKLETGTGGADTTDYFGVAGYDLTINYDVDDNIDTIVYSNGITLTFNYSGDNISSITSSDGKAKNLFYDINDNLESVTFI